MNYITGDVLNYHYKLNQGFPTKLQTLRINHELQEWFRLEAEKEDAMETTNGCSNTRECDYDTTHSPEDKHDGDGIEVMNYLNN